MKYEAFIPAPGMLAYWRCRAGVSISEAADRCCVDIQLMPDLERGKITMGHWFTTFHAQRLADLYGVPLEAFQQLPEMPVKELPNGTDKIIAEIKRRAKMDTDLYGCYSMQGGYLRCYQMVMDILGVPIPDEEEYREDCPRLLKYRKKEIRRRKYMDEHPEEIGTLEDWTKAIRDSWGNVSDNLNKPNPMIKLMKDK